MTALQSRLEALESLRQSLSNDNAYWEPFIQRAAQQNPWFIVSNIQMSIDAITAHMLSAEDLSAWVSNISEGTTAPRRVGVIMAGNIPLVGFADWLAVFVTGHIAVVKCSDKDAVLFPAMINYIHEHFPALTPYTQIVERVQNLDAVIATGSNNTSMYFEQYFGHLPHIIRKNRTSVAIITGSESDAELEKIQFDILAYFGLGCRNVSKLYIPQDYDVKRLFEVWEKNPMHADFFKYKNNYDYNLSIFLLNNIPFYTDNNIILTEDNSLFSRISCVHFSRYNSIDEVKNELMEKTDDIQCIVCHKNIEELSVIAPGNTQSPGLTDYADGIDTLAFLQALG